MQMQPPPPPKPHEMGVEDLELKIDELEKEIPSIEAYVVKLQVDRTTLSRRLTMFRDNMRYMKKHEGTIVLDHYRKLKIEVKRVIEQLRQNDNNVDKFEKAKENTIKQIGILKMELDHKWAIEESKILQFPRKLDVEN